MSNTDITYKITVAVAHRWATGTLRGTGSRTVEVQEEPTILGGSRAIDKACELLGDKVLEDISPQINPNPGELGWPLDSHEDGERCECEIDWTCGLCTS